MTSHTELRFTRLAEANIRDILQYSVRTWGTDQRDTYAEILANAFHRIRLFPEIGRVSGDDPTIRELHLEHHTILYRYDTDANAVIILRVINPRRLRR